MLELPCEAGSVAAARRDGAAARGDSFARCSRLHAAASDVRRIAREARPGLGAVLECDVPGPRRQSRRSARDLGLERTDDRLLVDDGEAEVIPRNALIIIGKKHMTVTIAILEPSSTPNQTIASGAIATIGTALDATAYGSNASATMRQRLATSATMKPALHPMT